MRLVIKRNLAEQIEEEVKLAQAEGLVVERIEVTRHEWTELSTCPEDPLGQRFYAADGELFILGIPVFAEDTVKHKRAERVHG